MQDSELNKKVEAVLYKAKVRTDFRYKAMYPEIWNTHKMARLRPAENVRPAWLPAENN